MKTVHSFNILVAAKLKDIGRAVLLDYIAYWTQKNAANNRNFHDNGYWTYNTLDGFAKLFPYMTVDQIRRRLDWLVEHGYVLKGNYNEHQYDRTTWYTITYKAVELFAKSFAEYYHQHLAYLPQGKGEDAEPIPYPYHTHTIPNTNNINKERAEPDFLSPNGLKK